MKADSRLADKLDGKDFIITAEYLPRSSTDASAIEAFAASFTVVRLLLMLLIIIMVLRCPAWQLLSV